MIITFIMKEKDIFIYWKKTILFGLSIYLTTVIKTKKSNKDNFIDKFVNN